MAVYNKTVKRLEELRKLPYYYLQDHKHKELAAEVYRLPSQKNVVIISRRSRECVPSHLLSKKDQAKLAKEFFNSLCGAQGAYKSASIVDITDSFAMVYLPCYVPTIHSHEHSASRAAGKIPHDSVKIEINQEPIKTINRFAVNRRLSGIIWSLTKALFLDPLTLQLKRLSPLEIPHTWPVVLRCSNPYQIQEVMPNLYDNFPNTVFSYNHQLAPWLLDEALSGCHISTRISSGHELKGIELHKQQVYLSKTYWLSFVNLTASSNQIKTRKKWNVLGTNEHPITPEMILATAEFIKRNKQSLIANDKTMQYYNTPRIITNE